MDGAPARDTWTAGRAMAATAALLASPNGLALRASASHSTVDGAYVLDIAVDPSEAVFAAAGSDFGIGLYDRNAMSRTRALGAGRAHADRINQLCWAPAHSDALPGAALFSASSDGAVCAWDGRAAGASAAVATLRERREEVWAVSVGAGPSLAAGTQTAVLIWDARAPARPVHRWEVHTEAVSQARERDVPPGDHDAARDRAEIAPRSRVESRRRHVSDAQAQHSPHTSGALAAEISHDPSLGIGRRPRVLDRLPASLCVPPGSRAPPPLCDPPAGFHTTHAYFLCL